MVRIEILRKLKGEKTRQKNLRLTIKRVKSADIKTRNKLIGTVAKKTGLFRRGVDAAMQKEITKLTEARGNVFNISLKKGSVEAIDPITGYDYAKPHTHPGSKYGSSYKKPTTPGTKPLDVRVWNRLLAKNIKANLPDFGFKVSSE